MPSPQPPRRVSLVTLGCARNDVDSEELAGRLTDGGWQLADEAEDADVVVVNTCGFIDAAKKDSIDTVLAAADTGQKVVAVGCLAERYGTELAQSLPEADAVLGFDHYQQLPARLDDVLAGRAIEAHVPQDRRMLLPISPSRRQAVAVDVAVPGHKWAPTARARLTGGPVAALKIASGCDRKCSFCAIPSFRGSYVSRTPDDIVTEARWLAGEGVRELFLVSENSTAYGKDLGYGAGRGLEQLLPRLAEIDGIDRVRVSYLQPAETRPDLVRVIATTPGIAPYFDLSFQHASAAVLRRMRRFGGTDSFLALIDQVRHHGPEAGIRTNVIVGFPGETDDDIAELQRFLTAARLDVVGVFGYSDEDGTEAAEHEPKVPPDVITERVQAVSELVEELSSQRAEDRVGTVVDVLIEHVDGEVSGRAAHQGPDTDGECRMIRGAAGRTVGEMVRCEVVDTDGVDLLVRPPRE